MNIFETIKFLINRKKVLQLNPGSVEHANLDDTGVTITIEQIEKILKDEENFKKFLNPKENQSFFHDGIIFNTYVQAVRDYIKFFLQRSVVFDKEVLKRASIITGEKFKNNKPKPNSYYNLKEIASKLITLPDVSQYNPNSHSFDSLSDFVKYMNDENIVHSDSILDSVCGFEVIASELRAELIKLPTDLNNYSDVLVLNDEMQTKIDSLSPKRENIPEKKIIKTKTRFDSTKYTINPDFEKLVMSHIPKDITDKGKLAYEIYKAVCLCVEYDVGYFIKGNDELSQDFIKRLRNKTLSELDENDNRVICTRFTELYCYFLSKYDIESEIIETKSLNANEDGPFHWSARVKLENDIILVDGTNGIFDQNGVNMTDMTRAKIGLNPANFKSFKKNDYSSEVDSSALGYVFQKDVDIIQKLIEEQDLDLKRNEITISDRLEIMKLQLQKLKGTNLGNYATVQYMTALFGKLLPQNYSKNIVRITKSLYTQDAEDIYSYFPIIYMKSSNDEYVYYAYDEEQGLRQISREILKSRIQSGDLQYIKGKEGHIPGLDDLKDKPSVTNAQSLLENGEPANDTKFDNNDNFEKS